MKNYDKYIIEHDWIRGSQHLYYLCGYVEKENVCYCIASYSIKTDKLLIKCASKHIPNKDILEDFVKHAKKCAFEKARENFEKSRKELMNNENS